MHEAVDFNLGEYRDAAGYRPHGRSLKACLSIAPSVRSAEISYVEKNHNPGKIFHKTLELILNSEMTGYALYNHVNAIERSYVKLRHGHN